MFAGRCEALGGHSGIDLKPFTKRNMALVCMRNSAEDFFHVQTAKETCARPGLMVENQGTDL